MILGLSGRLFEGIENRPSAPEFIAYAAGVGYKAVELRSSQLSEDTPDSEFQAIRQALDEHKVLCHYINCRVEQTEETKPVLRRHVAMAAALGCEFVQVRAEWIPWLQDMCDFAADFGVKLFQQFHTGDIMETVAGAVTFTNNVDRPNFGIGYEPFNLMAAREDYGIETLKRIGEKLFVVKCQSLRHADDPNAAVEFEHRGQRFVRCLPDAAGGVDYPKVFAALKEFGYDGPVTIMDGPCSFMDNDEYIRRYFDYLNPLCW